MKRRRRYGGDTDVPMATQQFFEEERLMRFRLYYSRSSIFLSAYSTTSTIH
jgi:hypothetical protein